MLLSPGPMSCHVNQFLKWGKEGPHACFGSLHESHSLWEPSGIKQNGLFVLQLLFACESLSQFSSSFDTSAGCRSSTAQEPPSHRFSSCKNQIDLFRESLQFLTFGRSLSGSCPASLLRSQHMHCAAGHVVLAVGCHLCTGAVMCPWCLPLVQRRE